MKVVHHIEYEIMGRFTCGEIIDVFNKSGGNVMCRPFGGSYFMDTLDDDVHMIFTSWAWIQDQRGNKKIYILDYPRETREVTKS